MGSHWVTGVCDSLLSKVQAWLRAWHLGTEAATRTYMSRSGNLEEIPVKRSLKIAWHPKELEHLIRILKVYRPDWQFVVELEGFYQSSFRRGRLLPGGFYQVDMVSYQEDVKEILEILYNAKLGRESAAELAKQAEGGSFWSR